jgi:hypothetical protein
MPGRGPTPKDPAERRTRHKPQRGEYQAAPGVGWQHGPLPKAPDGLLAASREAWEVWMRAWFAAHWTPDDLPGLRKVIQLYDATERGEMHRCRRAPNEHGQLRNHPEGPAGPAMGPSEGR